MMRSNQARSQIIENSSKMDSDYELTPEENIEFAERTIQISTAYIEELKSELNSFYKSMPRPLPQKDASESYSTKQEPWLFDNPYIKLMRSNIAFHKSLIQDAHKDIASAKEELRWE